MNPGRQVSAFDELPGWRDDDHVAALTCLRMSAKHSSPQTPKNPQLSIVLKKILGLGHAGRAAAREFLESNFRPARLAPGTGAAGFVTGYYEPVIGASRTATNRFRYPLYRTPDDLAETASGTTAYFDRRAIRQGALTGRNLELAWLESSVDQFFIHVQGSARLEFEDGSTVRVGYATKSGHPYTAIGKVLVEQGHLRRDAVTMDAIRDWLLENPGLADAIMDQNRSYIFFRIVEPENPDLGPVGAAGVQLTAGRSIAVDPGSISFGLPVWIATRKPLPHESRPFRRLMIAQDAGSAITGPARGDLFIGSGREAGSIAGAIRHEADFFVLEPFPGQG